MMTYLLIILVIQLLLGSTVNAGRVLRLEFDGFHELLQLNCDHFSKCDFVFKICIDEATGSPGNVDQCHFYHNTTKTLNKHKLFLSISHWPKKVLLKIAVMDKDTFTADDLVDTLHEFIDLDSKKPPIVILRNKTEVKVKFSVSCLPDYYGPQCEKYCSLNSSLNYVCNKNTGDIECKKGWSGSLCNVNSSITKTKFTTQFLFTSNLSRKSTEILPTKHFDYKEVFSYLNINTGSSENEQTTGPTKYFFTDGDYVSEHPVDILPDQTQTSRILETHTTSMSPELANPVDYQQASSFPPVTNGAEINHFSTFFNWRNQNANLGDWSNINQVPLDDTKSSAARKRVLDPHSHVHAPDFYHMILNGSVGNLVTVIQDALRHEVGDEISMVLNVKVAVTDGILQYEIYSRNKLPDSIVRRVERLQPNIESALAHVITAHHQTIISSASQKRKGMPEWGIVLTIIAIVAMVAIGIFQTRRYCRTNSSVKPQELKEEPDPPTSSTANTLNFINPIYCPS